MRRNLVAAFGKTRKHPEYGVNGPWCVLAAGVGLARGNHQVLTHSQTLEDSPALRHQCDAARRYCFWRKPGHRVAKYGHLAPARRQKAHRHVHAGRFAGAVAAKEAEHARFAEFKGHVAEDMTVTVEG